MSECDRKTTLEMLTEWIERLGGTIPAPPRYPPALYIDSHNTAAAGAARWYIAEASACRTGSYTYGDGLTESGEYEIIPDPDFPPAPRAALSELASAVAHLTYLEAHGGYWELPVLVSSARDELERIEETLRAEVG